MVPHIGHTEHITKRKLVKGKAFRKSYRINSLETGYVDFIEVYLDLDEASKLFGTKADIFKELFIKNLGEMLTFQIDNECNCPGTPRNNFLASGISM